MKKIISLFVVGFWVLGMLSFSWAMMCGEHSQHQQTVQAETGEHTHVEGETITESTSAEPVNVGNKICPISGEKIDEKMKATYEYEGKIYNFCCEMCIEEFKKDPEKYIEKVEEELKAESVPQPETPKGMHEGHHH